jgi:hypothetical protein
VKIVAAFAAVVAAAVAAAGGSTASEAPVLGFDLEHGRLAWFDPETLRAMPGRKPAVRSVCSWSFSPDRALLAYSDCNGTFGFVDARTMRASGGMTVAGRLGSVSGLAWLRPDRLLAFAQVDTLSTLLVVDPRRRRVLRRVDLSGTATGRTVVGGRVVFLVRSFGSFQPARVAVADADGTVRTATVDRISTGTIVDEDAADRDVAVRGVGFAVDRDGGRAFVVSPELVVGEVDLDSLAISYHGATRLLAKSMHGPSRDAAWLGDGLLAVSGYDATTAASGADRTMTISPYGLHVVDTRTWTDRTIDPEATGFARGRGVLLTWHYSRDGRQAAVALAPDGTERYRLPLATSEGLFVQGRLGYVCTQTSLVRVVDTSTGATIATPKNAPCVTLLAALSSDW